MGITVLLIDDSKFIHAAFTSALEKAGFRVISAWDGQSGLDAARKVKPDAIILDLNMPIMNGWQVLRSLKINRELRKIPVIVATTENKIGEIEQGFAMGAKDYVIKTESLSKLIAKLEKIFSEDKSEKGWIGKIFS